MVIASFRFFPVRELRKQLRSILRAIQGPTRAQPHCVACQLYEEDDYDESLFYLERWDSESDFRRHACSDQYRQILEAAELSRRAPEIEFHQVSGTRGMDLLEELRDRDGGGGSPTQKTAV